MVLDYPPNLKAVYLPFEFADVVFELHPYLKNITKLLPFNLIVMDTDLELVDFI